MSKSVMEEFMQERIAERKIAEQSTQKQICSECEGSGWVLVHSSHPPSFGECPKCYNPEGLESP